MRLRVKTYIKVGCRGDTGKGEPAVMVAYVPSLYGSGSIFHVTPKIKTVTYAPNSVIRNNAIATYRWRTYSVTHLTSGFAIARALPTVRCACDVAEALLQWFNGLPDVDKRVLQNGNIGETPQAFKERAIEIATVIGDALHPRWTGSPIKRTARMARAQYDRMCRYSDKLQQEKRDDMVIDCLRKREERVRFEGPVKRDTVPAEEMLPPETTARLRGKAQWPEPLEARPTIQDLREYVHDGICPATDGCDVEPDGVCEHGHPSWLLRLGYI